MPVSGVRLPPIGEVKVKHTLSDRTMGKVHGSLARAGKVRGQTPKVSNELVNEMNASFLIYPGGTEVSK